MAQRAIGMDEVVLHVHYNQRRLADVGSHCLYVHSEASFFDLSRLMIDGSDRRSCSSRLSGNCPAAHSRNRHPHALEVHRGH